MSINFSAHSQALERSYKQVLDPNDPTNWAMYTYGTGNDLKLVETGDGGLDELVQEFEGSKIQYAFAKVIEPNSTLPKFLLISWCGEGVPIFKKGLFNNHVNEVANYFKGFHVHINARFEEDIKPSLIMKKIIASSGAKYSIQQNVQPPVSHPAPAAKPFVPPAVSSAPKPSFVPKPSYTAPVKPAAGFKPAPVFKPTPAPVIPVNTAVEEEEPKPLFSSASSAYVPIKTNPKPLNNVFEAKIASSNSQAPAKPVFAGAKPVPHVGFQNNHPEPVTSTYQPVKTNPKPLAGAGVAKFAQQQSDPLSESQERARKASLARKEQEALEMEQERLRLVRLHEEQKRKEEEMALLQRQREDVERREREQRQQEEMQRRREHELAETRAQEDKRRRDQELAELRAQDQRRREQELAESRRQQEANERIQRETEERQRQQQLEQERLAQRQLQFAPTHQNSNSVRARALYDYAKDEENEINLMEGEIIENINTDDAGWWLGTNSRGESGLFPANYVEIILRNDASLATLTSINQLNEPEPEPQVVPTAEPVKDSRGVWAVALYDYAAEEDNEISFAENDVITNIEFVSEEWWSGTINGQHGLFPGTYVELKNN